MTQEEVMESLLMFFKALSDANRLKIIGLLAQGEHSVSELAELLGISISTTSNHLAMLAHVGLATARVDGHYYYYSLETENLRKMTEKLLKEENLPKLSGSVDMDAYESKVLSTFLEADGRIKAFPAQQKKYIVILKHVLQAFEKGRRYPEKELNMILKRFSDDTASLRRGMIEYKMMAREGGGGEYWRID